MADLFDDRVFVDFPLQFVRNTLEGLRDPSTKTLPRYSNEQPSGNFALITAKLFSCKRSHPDNIKAIIKNITDFILILQ